MAQPDFYFSSSTGPSRLPPSVSHVTSPCSCALVASCTSTCATPLPCAMYHTRRNPTPAAPLFSLCFPYRRTTGPGTLPSCVVPSPPASSNAFTVTLLGPLPRSHVKMEPRLTVHMPHATEDALPLFSTSSTPPHRRDHWQPTPVTRTTLGSHMCCPPP